MNTTRAVAVIVALAAFSGCATEAVGRTPIAQQADGAATPTPTVAATLPPTPTPTVTLGPTPSFGEDRLVPDILFGGQLTGCSLPCWNGLRVGESSFEDVSRFYVDGLKFNTMPPLIEDRASFLKSHGVWILAPPALHTDGEDFFLEMFFNKDLETLQGIALGGDSDRFRPYLSPYNVLRELGKPAHLLITPVRGTEVLDYGNTSLWIIYSNGISINYSIPVHISYDSAGSNGVAEVCLDDFYGDAQLSFQIFITPRFTNGLNNLSPIQNRLVGEYVTAFHYQPIEVVANTTMDEVMDLADQQSNPCFPFKFS